MTNNPAFDNLRDRHTSVIDENTRRIKEQIGYARDRIDKGCPETIGLIVDDIAAACRRISVAVSGLETIEETEKALKKAGQ
jgi:hypothetical protein